MDTSGAWLLHRTMRSLKQRGRSVQLRGLRPEFEALLQLIDTHSNKILAAKELDEIESAPSEDAYGGAIAANRALQRLLGQLSEFCFTASGGR